MPGVAPANILILGGGVVGANAAKIAAGFQADVAILDINVDRLRYLDDVMPANVNVVVQRPTHSPGTAKTGRSGDRLCAHSQCQSSQTCEGRSPEHHETGQCCH